MLAEPAERRDAVVRPSVACTTTSPAAIASATAPAAGCVMPAEAMENAVRTSSAMPIANISPSSVDEYE